MKKNRKVFIVAACVAALILLILTVTIFFKQREETNNQKTSETQTQVSEVKDTNKETEIKTEVTIKESVLLNVPYTVQAPYANWSVHEESCEEAAALMYHYFLKNQNFTPNNVIPPDIAHKEILEMKSWQRTNYGLEPDLSLEKFGQFMTSFYEYKFSVKKNITALEIKKELSAGKPVIVPVITHALENPHYGRLPSYHLLVITGYNTQGVITNDAGVKEGQHYSYSWDILFKAIDAQTPKMKQGRELITLF